MPRCGEGICETALLTSKKDQAELNMIVDLERNDLGRICEVGTVKVTQSREIESHPTVYHGVATIEGELRPDVGLVDLLRATFPGGSITGAPKIRAMQIIDELEPTRRGPYCGAIGFISNDGHIEFNIAIRTMIATAGQIHVPVGGGIVADSNPSDEYEETLVKAAAMFRVECFGDDDPDDSVSPRRGTLAIRAIQTPSSMPPAAPSPRPLLLKQLHPPRLQPNQSICFDLLQLLRPLPPVKSPATPKQTGLSHR